jgi:hypothetical protein
MLSTTGPGRRDWTSRVPLQPGARAISNVDRLYLLVLWAVGCKNPNIFDKLMPRAMPQRAVGVLGRGRRNGDERRRDRLARPTAVADGPALAWMLPRCCERPKAAVRSRRDVNRVSF